MKNILNFPYKVIIILILNFLIVVMTIPQVSFMSEEQITDTNYESELTVSGDAIVIDSEGNVHLVYYEGAETLFQGSGSIYGSDADQVYYTFRGNGVWQTPLRISDGKLLGEFAAARQPSIAIDSSDTVHIVWHDYRNNGLANVEIYYDFKTVGGNFVDGDYRVTYTSSGVGGDNSYSPVIAITPQSNVINMVWWDFYYDGYIAESFGLSTDDNVNLNHTGSYSLDSYLLTEAGGYASIYPSIAVDSNSAVHLVWSDVGSYSFNNGGITYYRKMTELTQLSSSKSNSYMDILISNTSAGSTNPPRVAVDSTGKAYIVWSDNRDANNREIYLTTVESDGLTKGEEVRLTSSALHSDNSDIKIDSGDVPRIVWQDNKSGISQIYYAEYDKTNKILKNETQVSNSSSGAIFPHIVLDKEDGVHICWQDNREGNYDIFYCKSVPNTSVNNAVLEIYE